MSNPASLVPFKPGFDPKRNMKGNPGSKWLTTMLADALKKVANDQGEGFDVQLIKRVMRKAIVEGDMRAIEHVWDRLEGKPQQRHTVDSTLTHELSPEAEALAKQLIDAQRKPLEGSV